MFVHYIDNNILYSHPPYSVVYQDEYENWELYQDINNVLWLEPKLLKTAETGVHVTHEIIATWKISLLYSQKGDGWSGLVNKINKLMETHALKVGCFKSVLWRLLVAMCTVSSRNSFPCLWVWWWVFEPFMGAALWAIYYSLDNS